jgi:hypothetical protein
LTANECIRQEVSVVIAPSHKLAVTPIAIALSLAILLRLIFILPPAYPNGYDRNSSFYEMAYFDKENLLRRLAPPRVILVGGSNVAFSFDSNFIRQSLQMNVINVGVHIGFGICFMLNMVKKYLHPGDVVLICPEYEQFFGEYCGDDNLVNFAIYQPRLFSDLSPRQIIPLLLATRTLLNRKCTSQLKVLENKILPLAQPNMQQDNAWLYKRSSFNGDGDVSVVLREPHIPPGGFWLPLHINQPGKYDPSAITEINEFSSSVAKLGVKVVFCYPCISSSYYNNCKFALSNLDTRLKTQLKIPIVGTMDGCVMPDNCFYDTRYHLLTRFKTRRSSWILAKLRTIINLAPNTTTGALPAKH